MDEETRIWKGLALVIALITMAVPIWVTYDLYARGGAPEKSVELQYIGPINPLNDLSPLAHGTTLELSLGGQTYNSLVIQQFILRNEGKTPIIPGDFIEGVRVTSKQPWDIIAILGNELSTFSVDWKQLAPNQFEAKPFLLNPGDMIWQTAYLTKHPGTMVQLETNAAKPDIEVTARIVNLKAFTVQTSLLDRMAGRAVAIVYLPARSVLFLALIASVLLYWYGWAIEKSGIAAFPSARALAFLTLFALLSYSTAEVVTYYVFGGDELREELEGRHLLDWRYQIQNWVVMLIHVVTSLYLYRRIRKRH